jgi:outer membrane lipoprotein-sorting protein
MNVRAPLLGLLLVASPALKAASDLLVILKNMDQAAAKFEGMKAKIQRVNYTAIVDDKSVETGELRVRREKNKPVMLRLEIRDPSPLILAVNGTKAEIYYPRIAQVEEYDLSKSKNTLEQALSLGFGTAGKFLSDNYEVKVLAEQAVEGKPAVKLELIPKSPQMLKSTPKIEMWVSTETWTALQQKIYEIDPGDYRLYTYSEVALNPGLKDSDLELKIPRNTKRVFPQL